MVDSIKNQSRSLNKGSRPDSSSLRSNFKSISSTLRVVDSNTQTPSTEKSQAQSQSNTSNAAGGQDKVNQLLRGLNDAVSFSSMALKSLEQLTQSGGVVQHLPEGVRSFSKDLGKVRDNIQSVLEDLKAKADTADVIQENISSADAKLTDVDAAQAFAVETGSQINFNGEEAIDAHAGLTPHAVSSLLSE